MTHLCFTVFALVLIVATLAGGIWGYEALLDTKCYYDISKPIADPNNCRVYYECYNQEMYYKLCPVDENFDVRTQTCRRNSVFPCKKTISESLSTTTSSPLSTEIVVTVAPVTPSSLLVSDSVCRDLPNGFTVPVSTNCRTYSVCWYGIQHNGECAAGYSFNQQSNLCDITNNYKCEDHLCPPTGINTFRKFGSCNEYNFCFAGVHSTRSCATGLHFDSKQNRCAEPLVASCYACPVKDDFAKIVTFAGIHCDE